MITLAPAPLDAAEEAFFARLEAAARYADPLGAAIAARLSARLATAVRLVAVTPGIEAAAVGAARWRCASELDALWFARRLGARRIGPADLARRVPEQAALRATLAAALAETRVEPAAVPVTLAWNVECLGLTTRITLALPAREAAAHA